MNRTCHYCRGGSFDYQEANLRRCSGCKRVYYCSTACQEDDWFQHKFSCDPQRVTTADHLALAVYEDLLPVHPQTCEDYGFNLLPTDDERSNLLSLYIGLIKILRISPKTIHKWRVRGVLVDQIKATYYELPEYARGEYFPWFLQNEHIFVQPGQPQFAGSRPSVSSSRPIPVEPPEDNVDAALLRAWRFIGGSEKDSAEEIRAAIARRPEEDRNCHWLYVFLLSRWRPAPELEIWGDFGFAACTSRAEETKLSAAYLQLINSCTFKEFCDAHHTHRLLGLFRSKGVQLDTNRYLFDLLGGPWKKSVWYLKQVASQRDSPGEWSSVHPAAMVDYGFFNCRDDSERRELKRVYKAFFDTYNGDPLALHEAAIQGNIHGYLSTVMRGSGVEDPKFKRFMKNPYPLPEPDD